MGSRWISETLRISKGRVQAGIARLQAGGHVEIIVKPSGSRAAVYRLTSPVFGERQKVRLSDKQGVHDTTRAEIDRKIELARSLKLA